MRLLVLAGEAGAGKTSAIWALEAGGYYVVEDVPLKMVPGLFSLFQNEPDRYARVALVTGLQDVGEVVVKARQMEEVEVTAVGLTCRPEVLLSRYKLTRHIHPLMARGYTLEEALVLDKQAFDMARFHFDAVIDTSDLSEKQLRKRLNDITREDGRMPLGVNFVSFGYKYGIPLDADTIFDARVLANPFWVEELRNQTGLDRPVRDYIRTNEKTTPFLKSIYNYLDRFLPLCSEDGRSYVYIHVGCSGGQHRSVYIAERLYKHYKGKYRCSVYHRELEKDKRK